MSLNCPECGAPVPDGGSCRDRFHTLLQLEWTIPGVPGSILHFYAVAAYNLQHPDTMNLTAESLAGLRAAVASALDGRADLDALRRRARRAAEGAVRVRRRPGDPPVPWPRGDWPATVADACPEGPDHGVDGYEAYAERVVSWARAVCETLDARGVGGLTLGTPGHDGRT